MKKEGCFSIEKKKEKIFRACQNKGQAKKKL